MKYKPFEQDEFKYELGLKPLETREWIEIDSDWQAQRQLKAELFKNQREKVFQALPNTQAPAQELLLLLADHLVQYFPEKFQRQSNAFIITKTGEQFDLDHPSDHPLAVLSQWVQEDFCLMNTSEKEARLEAGSVCFPSKWKLIEKVGHNMAGIHTPVPGFNKSLEKPSTRFLLNTLPDKPMWRMNWSIHASNQLFAYESESHADELTEENVLEKTYFRVERQTLRRLPQSKYVVFTIRTYLNKLSEIASRQGQAEKLLNYLKTVPEEVIHYRSMQTLMPLVQSALIKEGKVSPKL